MLHKKLISDQNQSNNLFDEIDSEIFENSLYSFRNLIHNQTSKFNLLEQLKINKNGLKIFLYQALIFIIYNINVNHLYFSFLSSKLGLLLAILILTFFELFSFIFQITLINKMEKNQEDNLVLMLENHFGNLCSLFFKYCCFGWISLNYLYTFLMYIHFTIKIYYGEKERSNPIKFSENWKFYIVVIIIFILVFLIIKVFQNSNSFDLNIFLNFLLNLFFTFYVGKRIYEGNPNKNKINMDSKNDDLKYNVIKSIYLLPNSFNNLLILFLVNKNLKLSLYPLLEHKKFLFINHFLIYIFYLLFLILGIYYDSKNDEENFLLYIIKDDPINQLLDFIFVVGNLISQLLNINFYLFIMKNSIIKSNDKLKLIGFKNFIFSLFLLIIGGFIGLFCYLNKLSPKNIILINNATFGLLINFLFPSLFILKYTLSFSIYFILGIIFLIFSICLIHVYEYIDDKLLLLINKN